MNISTKFDLGQTVYAIAHEPVYITDPCGFCETTGEALRRDGSTGTCPRCNGAGFVERYAGHREWQSIGGRVVQYVSVAASSVGTAVQYRVQYRRDADFGIRKEADLFATLEEAKVACEERNAEAVAS